MRVGHEAAFAVVAMSIAASCASRSTRSPASRSTTALVEREIEVGGLYFELRRGPGGVEIVDTTDAVELLAEGNRLLSGDRVDQALERYRTLLSLFPRSPLAPAARFNAGLACERRGQPTAALVHYRAAIAAGDEVAFDARLRVAAIATEAGDGEAALAALGPIADRSDVAADRRLELAARRGAALVVAGDLDRGGEALDAAYTVATSPRSANLRHRAFFWAMAGYYRGAVEVERMKRVTIADTDSLADADRHRAAAVERFAEVIDSGDAVWISRAVHDAAVAHETLASKVVADTPAKGEAELAERRALMKPLLSRAIDLHRQNVAHAAAAGIETVWSRRSADRVRAAEAAP